MNVSEVNWGKPENGQRQLKSIIFVRVFLSIYHTSRLPPPRPQTVQKFHLSLRKKKRKSKRSHLSKSYCIYKVTILFSHLRHFSPGNWLKWWNYETTRRHFVRRWAVRNVILIEFIWIIWIAWNREIRIKLIGKGHRMYVNDWKMEETEVRNYYRAIKTSCKIWRKKLKARKKTSHVRGQ